MLKIDKQEITLTRGDTAYLRFIPQVFNKKTCEWEDRILEDGDRVVFRMTISNNNVFEKDLFINVEENTAKLSLDEEDTENLEFKTYYYEVELITSMNEHFTFVAHQRFTIGKEEQKHE